MARTFMADGETNQALRHRLATRNAHFEVDRRLDQAFQQTHAQSEKNMREDFVPSGFAILAMVFAVLGTVALSVYLLVFALR